MTEQELYDRFIAAVLEAGGQAKFAGKLGMSATYVNDMVHKRRPLSDHVLRLIGIERITTVVYREVRSNT